MLIGRRESTRKRMKSAVSAARCRRTPVLGLVLAVLVLVATVDAQGLPNANAKDKHRNKGYEATPPSYEQAVKKPPPPTYEPPPPPYGAGVGRDGDTYVQTKRESMGEGNAKLVCVRF